MDRIFVITENYPFGRGEEFFETEIKFLTQRFAEVIIISMSPESSITRKVPENVFVKRIVSNNGIISKFRGVKFFFCREFHDEMKYIRKIYCKRITFSILKFLLWTMVKAEAITRTINDLSLNIPRNDRIYLYSYWMHYGAYAIAKLRRTTRFEKAFCRAHGFDLYFERNNMNYIPLRSYIINNLDYIFPISSDGGKYLASRFPQSEARIVVSRLGILGGRCEFTPPKENSTTLNLLSISNFNEVKRVGLLVEALAHIDVVAINWTHIGAGGALEDDLKSLAKRKIQEKNNIRYEFKGYLENSQVMDFYQSTVIDLFINVSESEGIPVSMMEAQSFSIPIIATEVGGVPEIVNANNGFLLPANPTPVLVARRIEEFAVLPVLEIGKMRKASFTSWSNYFNAEKNYPEFISWF